jgi:hypothetical protein
MKRNKREQFGTRVLVVGRGRVVALSASHLQTRMAQVLSGAQGGFASAHFRILQVTPESNHRFLEAAANGLALA